MTKPLFLNQFNTNLKNFTENSFLEITKKKKYPEQTKCVQLTLYPEQTKFVQFTLYPEQTLYHKLFYYKVHLGHKSLKVKSAWHSSMSRFLLGSRNNSGVLKSKSTLTCFLKAFYILTLIVKSGGSILIINTNPEFSKLLQHVKKNTKSSKIFYSDCHWVGGTLTNWIQISQSISTFSNFYYRFDDFLLKNNIYFPRYKKMKKSFKGFLINKSNSRKNHTYFKCDWKPDLIFLLNSDNTEAIIAEASSLQIPIISLVNSNTCLANITYPIPTNTDSFNFAWFCLNWITRITNKYHSKHGFLS